MNERGSGSTETSDTERMRCIEELSQKNDLRSQKWEYRVILDGLQEFDGEAVSVPVLLNAVNSKHGVELLTYSSVYHHLGKLAEAGAVHMDPHNKTYHVDEKYITYLVRYMPLSDLCIYLFGFSVAWLILAMISRTLIWETTLVVAVGALYLLSQYLGSEFNLGRILESLHLRKKF